jgi:hypothetical protein
MQLAVEAGALVVVVGLVIIKAALTEWERDMLRRDGCY